MPAIGATFSDELIAAGLGGLPISWDAATGAVTRGALTTQQNSTLDAVIAAHNPSKQAWTDVIKGDMNTIDIAAQLRGKTPAQIMNYVQNNVTDLASAKVLMAKMLLLISRLL